MSSLIASQLNSLTMPVSNKTLDIATPKNGHRQIPDQSAFALKLHAQQNTNKPDTTPLDPVIEKKLRKAANDFVSIALFQPLLKQLRNDPFETDLFNGGMAEDMFTERMDQNIATSLSQSSSGLFGEQVFKDFARLAQSNAANLQPESKSAAQWKANLPQSQGIN